jgi:hypothetical protein
MRASGYRLSLFGYRDWVTEAIAERPIAIAQ